MRQDNKRFSRLLPLDELYSLYSRIGDSINTDIDLINANYDYLAKDNSIQLLIDLGIIAKNENNFSKNKQLDTQQSFSSELVSGIRNNYEKILNVIKSASVNYDESRGAFFGYRNDVALDYSGIMMLLNELGYLELSETCFYLKQQEYATTHIVEEDTDAKTTPITLVDLENSLLFKKKIGEVAEQEVLSFERGILKQQGIDKAPMQISHLDVSAGYDIVSFLSAKSEIPDKFIEVKSCDENEMFYISKNEIETARKKVAVTSYTHITEKQKRLELSKTHTTT